MTDFDDFNAREVATDWHGGQASGLYSLASTGSLVRADDIAREVRDCIAALDTPAYADSDYVDEYRTNLSDLLAYVEASPEYAQSQLEFEA